jgi:2-oxoacid:acceptor oxidoreductase delta subunit (pyruvate/2-ketoisovalerate family)
MAELRSWQELPAGGVVPAGETVHPHTGGWRTGVRPQLELATCVDCLLCWVYCPDAAIVLDGEAVDYVDLDYCKGCELCATVCPVGAIEMVPDA